MGESKTVAPFGTWESPITKEIVSGGSVSFNEVHVDQNSGRVYLVEGRPAENGRAAIVEIKGTDAIELLPKEYSAKAKIHEYGGGACGLSPNGSIIFNDKDTDGVFALTTNGGIEEIISGDPKLRFADFSVHPTELHWIIAVHEDHRASEVQNMIVAINAKTKSWNPIAQGADFYSHPRFSFDGKSLSWMQWNHPDMPWEGTELFIADWKDGKYVEGKFVAGKPREQSICQPRWHYDGSLFYEHDPTGFWQLYRYSLDTKTVEHIRLEGFEDAEIGARENPLGNSTYISLNEDELVITYTKKASNGLLLHNLAKKSTVELQLGLIDIQRCALKRLSDTQFVIIGGTATGPIGLYLVDVEAPSEKKLLKSTASIDIPPSIFSQAQHVTFPRTHGSTLGMLSHAYYIPPHNPHYEGPPGAKPPLIVNIHGGPTSHSSPGLSLEVQYYTSRGYAYVLVNHAGSTGYGRAYRDELKCSWGLKDVEDSVSCIEYLAGRNLVDGSKVGIRGGSAGGYTTLQALVNYPKVFTAGCSLFGIGNLRLLAQDTHKFESQYLFGLLYPEATPNEEKERIYTERSPCLHADKIERPLVMLQGDMDKVVPMEQSIEMERILKGKGGDVKLVIFEGEGHGFVMKKHIQQTIVEEEGLWQRTLLV